MSSKRRSFPLPGFALPAAMALLLLILLLLYPAESMEASVRGIAIWWDVLFPSLFPFLVLSELLLSFGIVHFFGTLLDPLMRPIFRVPGIGGFVLAMGFASGYPVGAKLTAQLWEQGYVNRDEGERLVAFTTTSDPIFLIGAVSVGFFHDAGLAVILAAAHYGSALLIGFLMRFHGIRSITPTLNANQRGSILVRSLRAMHLARLQDIRPFGEKFRQAVQSSIQLIFVIGGLVVFFSAVLQILNITRVMNVAYSAANAALHLFGLSPHLSDALVKGLFEVTLGAKSAGAAPASIPLVYKAAVGAMVLSWAGLSVHAQIVSILHRTNLRYMPFLIARIGHGFLSAGAVLFLWNPLSELRGKAAAAWASLPQPSEERFIWAGSFPFSLALALTILLLLSVWGGLTSLGRYRNRNE